MPTAPVDGKGTFLYYEDTGPPAGSIDYTTLVLVHGTCFHSAVYRPMIPFAAKHDFRLVLLNLRGYPGSTDYSQDDFDLLRGPCRDRQQMSIATRGIEIAAFLRWLIETQDVQPIKEGIPNRPRSGGLSLLAWSGGICHILAMFANLDKVPEETRKLLGIYLRSFIMLDPPASALGYVLPANVAALRPNPSASVDQLVADFAVAVSSYYPPYTMQDSMDPTPLSNSLPLHEASAKVDQKFLPTTVKMKPEVLQSLIHPPIMGEHQRLMWALDIDILKDNLHRALLDCRFNVGPEPSKKVWPNLRVHLIYCDMTFRTCAWGATAVWLEHQRADQEYRRHLELHKLERANHFVHWEEPERFTSFLAGIV